MKAPFLAALGALLLVGIVRKEAEPVWSQPSSVERAAPSEEPPPQGSPAPQAEGVPPTRAAELSQR